MQSLFILLMGSTGSSSSGSSMWSTPLLFVGIFAVMYFFMIRPQAKKAKDQKSFIDNLQKGDKVITVAGIHGKITRVNDNGTVEVEIDTNTKVIMERSGISMEYTRSVQQPAIK
ncbi:MAG: preprotein translocase subunit YajC [Chitinophagales bacterium]